MFPWINAVKSLTNCSQLSDVIFLEISPIESVVKTVFFSLNIDVSAVAGFIFTIQTALETSVCPHFISVWTEEISMNNLLWVQQTSSKRWSSQGEYLGSKLTCQIFKEQLDWKYFRIYTSIYKLLKTVFSNNSTGSSQDLFEWWQHCIRGFLHWFMIHLRFEPQTQKRCSYERDRSVIRYHKVMFLFLFNKCCHTDCRLFYCLT